MSASSSRVMLRCGVREVQIATSRSITSRCLDTASGRITWHDTQPARSRVVGCMQKPKFLGFGVLAFRVLGSRAEARGEEEDGLVFSGTQNQGGCSVCTVDASLRRNDPRRYAFHAEFGTPAPAKP
eukprot:365126-Chlamydomonas_euryale.AAC.40